MSVYAATERGGICLLIGFNNVEATGGGPAKYCQGRTNAGAGQMRGCNVERDDRTNLVHPVGNLPLGEAHPGAGAKAEPWGKHQ